jgi:two-component system, LuxR family, response regulator FixJ
MSEEIYYQPSFSRDRLIHIVDPDLATCEALSVLFRLEGFQTSFSVDAGHFLIALERRRPDVVVLNLRIGAESGLSLLRRIKALRTAIPVFMLADYPQVEASVTAMKLGATDVVSKPIDTEHLLSGIFDALRGDVHVSAMYGGRRGIEVHGFARLTPRARGAATDQQWSVQQGSRSRSGHLPPHGRSAPRPRHGKTGCQKHCRFDAYCAHGLTEQANSVQRAGKLHAKSRLARCKGHAKTMTGWRVGLRNRSAHAQPARANRSAQRQPDGGH